MHVPIPVILHLLRLLSTCALSKPNFQICTRAVNSPVSRHDYTLHLRVNVKHGISGLDLTAHLVGERIVFAGAVQGEHDDAGLRFVVVRADAGPLGVKVVVAVGEHDVWHVPGGDLAGGHGRCSVV